MVGRLMGQLNAAARTGGVQDLLKLYDLLENTPWKEEMEAFAEAAEKAEEIASVLGTVEEIKVLQDEASQALSDAYGEAEGIVVDAKDEAKVIVSKAKKRDESSKSREVEAETACDERDRQNKDLRVRWGKLGEAEGKLVEEVEVVNSEKLAAENMRSDYERMIRELEAALPKKRGSVK